VTSGRVLGFRPRDRGRRVDADESRSRLGDDYVSVRERDRVTIASHGKQPLERRRQTQRDLDIVGVDKRRETPARVPAVRGRQRTPKAAWEGDLHALRHTKWLAQDRNPLARIPVARRSLKAAALLFRIRTSTLH